MLKIPVNHDVNKDFLILKCTCHLKTLNYCLQMAELSVNTCMLYKFYTITGHIIQRLYNHWPYAIKDIPVYCVFFVNISRITQ